MAKILVAPNYQISYIEKKKKNTMATIKLRSPLRGVKTLKLRSPLMPSLILHQSRSHLCNHNKHSPAMENVFRSVFVQWVAN